MIVEAVVRSAVKVVAVAAALVVVSYPVRFLVFCYISDCKILNIYIKYIFKILQSTIKRV